MISEPPPTAVTEPSPGTVVQWTRSFGPHGRPYTFAALRVDGLGWFLTGQWTAPVTWAEVLHLSGGVQMYAAQTWTPLLAAQPGP